MSTTTWDGILYPMRVTDFSQFGFAEEVARNAQGGRRGTAGPAGGAGRLRPAGGRLPRRASRRRLPRRASRRRLPRRASRRRLPCRASMRRRLRQGGLPEGRDDGRL